MYRNHIACHPIPSHPIPLHPSWPDHLYRVLYCPSPQVEKRKRVKSNHVPRPCLFCCATTYPTSHCALHTHRDILYPLAYSFLTDTEYGAHSYFAAAVTAAVAAGAAGAAAAVVFVLVVDVVAVVVEVVVDPATAAGALAAAAA